MSDDSKAAIEKADKARAAAVIAKDVATIAQYLSDDMIYVHSSSTRETKAEYLEKIGNEYYVYSGFDKGDITWRFAGDLAFLNGSVTIHVAVKGSTKVVKATYLAVWRNESGHWRLYAWQSTPIPAPPPAA